MPLMVRGLNSALWMALSSKTSDYVLFVIGRNHSEGSQYSLNIPGLLLTVLLKVQAEVLFEVSGLFYTDQNITWNQELSTQASRNFLIAHA